MTLNITQKVPEESSAGFLVTLTDETGAALTPTTVTWTLTDSEGTVINGRSEVPISAASSFTIVLSGDDLMMTRSSPVRLLLVEAVYSSSLGSALNLNEQIRFQIDPLTGVG